MLDRESDMPKSHIFMIIVLLALLTSGCDPIFTLRGSVRADANAAGIEEAQLRLFCPKDGEMHQFYPTISTDAQGRFDRQYIGEIPLECELRAQKEGFQLVDVPLREACTEKRSEEYCAKAEFAIELAPEPNSQ
jgi:hypothetical protein